MADSESNSDSPIPQDVMLRDFLYQQTDGGKLRSSNKKVKNNLFTLANGNTYKVSVTRH